MDLQGPAMPRLSHSPVRVPLATSAAAIAAAAIAAGILGLGRGAQAQSALLESVKQNPARAKALCQQLRQLNAQGISSTSPQAVGLVAQQQNLSSVDAEVLTTYVVGLYCPDVR
jgi:hypothetical protein